MVHPQWGILEQTLHTPSFVRSRSALLTTAVCAVGSTALATLPDAPSELVAEANALHDHVEKLNLVNYMTSARSIDIMQAQIVSRRRRVPAQVIDPLPIWSFCEDKAGRFQMASSWPRVQDGA